MIDELGCGAGLSGRLGYCLFVLRSQQQQLVVLSVSVSSGWQNFHIFPAPSSKCNLNEDATGQLSEECLGELVSLVYIAIISRTDGINRAAI